MANSPIVTSLPAYVDEQRLPLISKTILGAKTAGLVSLETDVKSKKALNLLATDVQFGDGSACGWNEAGSQTLSQRYIDPAFIKVNMGYCDKNLLNKWASHEVVLAAGREVLPFEEKFVGDVIDNVNEKVEKMLWTGEKGTGSCDGFYTILEDETTVNKVPVALGTGAYTAIKAVYKAIPSAVVMKEDTVIFVSEGMYRAFIQDLVAANLFHFNPDYKDGEYMLPGTSVRVIATSGLNGSASDEGEDKIVAGRLSNMFYGCGAEDDKNTFDLWYSKDNREFRLAIEFAAGVQVAYPNEMVISVDEDA